MVSAILLTLSIRFFLFDFILFKRVREYLKTRGYFFKKLLGCPFCQGFWCGLAVYLATNSISFHWQQLTSWLGFGFITAYLGLISAAVFYPLIQKYEENSGIPLQ
ncbi:MAG: hypothetical protein APF84_02065 [Gracilibacter sp. BRH_c7a]|nr:MAG: hypothetical protein APF84_02065 [Gracilibacter sp. BRH_c7a]